MRKKISLGFLYQKGQTMLIVVLAMVIALTVGLSIASRSITNLKTTTEEINSQKALAAAEAGIENALQKLTATSNAIPGSFDNGRATFLTTVNELSGSELLLAGGNPIGKDDGVDLWLVKHDSNTGAPDYSAGWPQNISEGQATEGQITVYWGQTEDECKEAALEIVIISGTKDLPVLKRYAVDPCSARTVQNKFSSPVKSRTTVSNVDFYYSYTIPDLIINGLLARIIPLYTSASVAVKANPGFYSQGSIISSTGTSGSTERKVTVFQGYSSLPAEYFSNSFFYHSL